MIIVNKIMEGKRNIFDLSLKCGQIADIDNKTKTLKFYKLKL